MGLVAVAFAGRWTSVSAAELDVGRAEQGLFSDAVGTASLTGDWLSWLPWILLMLVAGSLVFFFFSSLVGRFLGGPSPSSRKNHHLNVLEDSMNEVMWTADTNLEVTYCSPSVLRLLGHPAHSVVGRPLGETFGRMAAGTAVGDGILWAIHGLSVEGKLYRSHRAGMPELEKQLSLTLRTASGHLVPVDVTLWAHMDEQGNLLQVRGTMRASRDLSILRTGKLGPMANGDAGHEFWNRCVREMGQLTAHCDTMVMTLIECDTYDAIAQRWDDDAARKVVDSLLDKAIERAQDGAFSAKIDARRIAIIHPYCSISEGASEAEAIRRALALLPIEVAPGQRLSVSASFGVAVTQGQENLATLIQRAEAALQQAQANGGNMVCLSVGSPPLSPPRSPLDQAQAASATQGGGRKLR
jgi:diguanylate cyclase (GGDEF)-like protein